MLCSVGNAQVAPPNTVKEAAPLQLTEGEPLSGTYQIVIKKGAEQVQLSGDALKQVEKNRSHDKEVFLKVSESVKIKVLPYSIINAPDFKPVELYSYEN
jgi:hypothetical protein